MRWFSLSFALLLASPTTTWAHGGGHGGGGGHFGGSHFGGGHFGGGHFGGGHFGHTWSQPHWGVGYTGYGGLHHFGSYANWHYYGWGWHRPIFWPAYWMGGYWSPLWPVYEVWPFYNVRVADPAVVVNNSVMMAPVDSRYYYHDAEPADVRELVDLTQMEPVFSGPQDASYNVHREENDPPLLLGQASYPTGFAVSAPSSLRFELPGSPGTFKVHFGVMLRGDPACSAAEAPLARFTIVGDGRTLFESDDSDGSTVTLPVAGVRMLELRIGAQGAHSLACAWGIWAEPEITPHP